VFVCDDLRTEVWRPDFSSSAQASPVWTRVLCRGMQITNSLEWVEWTENPVQVVLCDACGYAQCASGGYVHVSRWNDCVLWSAPQRTGDDDLADEEYETPRMLRTVGALAIPIAVWNDWATAIGRLPRANRIIQSNHAAVADAWVLGRGRSTGTIVPYLRDRLVGCDTLEREQAIALVEQTLARLRTNEEAPYEQPLLSATACQARIETLYFDGPGELDWPAFAFLEDRMFIALDRQRITRIEP
jgi:hypothetical protein